MDTERTTDQAVARLCRDGRLSADDPSVMVMLTLFAGLGSAGSIERYGRDLTSFFAWLRTRPGGPEPLAASRADLIGWLGRLRDRGLSPDTRRRVAIVVARFYDEAIRAGLLAFPGPADGLPRIEGDARDSAAALRREEVTALFALIDADLDARDPRRVLQASRDHLLVALLLGTGLRAAEVVGLQPGDRARVGDRAILHVIGKGERAARVPLTASLDAAIDEWLSTAAAAGLSLGPRDPLIPPLGRSWPPRLTLVRGQGRPLTAKALHHLVFGWLSQLRPGERRTGPHLLRRTSGTWVYLATHDPILAQRHLRHRSVVTTERHYIKPAEEFAEVGIDVLDLPDPRLSRRHSA